MRLSLLTVAALLLAATAAAAAGPKSDSEETQLQPAVSPSVAIGMLMQIANIYNTNFFTSTGAVNAGGLLKTGLDFVKFLFGIFDNPNRRLEDLLRRQFAEVHRKLDTITNRIDDVLRLIKFEGTIRPIRDRVIEIQGLSDYLHRYVTETDAGRRSSARASFLRQCRLKRAALLQSVYDSVMRRSNSIQENLGEAALHYTRHTRRQVAQMMLDMNRYIMRGIEVEVACIRVEATNDAQRRVADHELQKWQDRMPGLMNKLFDFDRKTVNYFSRNWRNEIRDIVNSNNHKSNADLSRDVYNHVSRKFHWRNWLVVSHNRNSNGHWNIDGSYDAGTTERYERGKVVVVAHRDPKSRFDRNRAVRVLADINGLKSRAAYQFKNLIVERFGRPSGVSPFVFVVSDLVNVAHAGSRRTAYLRMTYTCGRRTCAMYTWVFG